MLIKLFFAGRDDYRKVLRRRCALFILLIVLGLGTLAASFVLAWLDVALPSFAWGFYGGVGTGVAGFSIVGLVGTRRLMRDEKKMRAEEIKETDERAKEVTLRAASATVLVLIVLTYVALMVAVVVNQTVFFTLMAAAAVFFVVFLSATAYYKKKAVSAAPRRLELTAAKEQEGVRVDALLRNVLGLSGTVIRRVKWLPDGILLDGVRVNVGVAVRAGQTLSVLVGDPARRSQVVPVPGPLDIVYEDADLVVLNKPPALSVHPGPGHWTDTLGNYLLAHYDENGEPFTDFHPVHRLDKGTSGLIVVVKHAHAQEKLKGQLHTGGFRRVYLAVCEGAPSPAAGVVDAPLGRKDGSLIEQEVRPDGLPARTRYETLAVKGGRALLRLELDTGRTHQIRVHMARLGHPLTGDFLYGKEDRSLIARPALHSARLELTHPITGARLVLRSPLPEDIAGLLV